MGEPKISVIIPTNRPGGLEHAKASLPGQTFKDFEVLVGSPFDPGFGKWVVDDFKGGFWSLGRIYNRLFAEAKGELIVTLQDFIWVRPDGLARFWDVYERTKGLITGVGNQYQQVGLDGSHGKPCWVDYRRDLLWTCGPRVILDTLERQFVVDNPQIRGLLRPFRHEWNWAAMPKDAIIGVGGMDEEMDFLGFSCDNVSAIERMFAKGHLFFIDYGNEVYCQSHGRVPGWEEHHTRYGLYDLRKQELQDLGNWPVLTSRSRLPSVHRPNADVITGENHATA